MSVCSIASGSAWLALAQDCRIHRLGVCATDNGRIIIIIHIVVSGHAVVELVAVTVPLVCLCDSHIGAGDKESADRCNKYP